jgi:hypothetical protein
VLRRGDEVCTWGWELIGSLASSDIVERGCESAVGGGDGNHHDGLLYVSKRARRIGEKRDQN